MSNTDKAVMQQALDALLGYKPYSLTHAKEQGSAIIAIRAAIAQPVQLAVSDAIAPDAITINLMRLVGLDKHIAQECEAVVHQMFAAIAQPEQKPFSYNYPALFEAAHNISATPQGNPS